MASRSAHALAIRRGIKDTSAQGNRYHNKRFAALAAAGIRFALMLRAAADFEAGQHVRRARQERLTRALSSVD